MSLAKSLIGMVKDKAVITATRVTDDEVNRAVLKCTSHDIEAPNEKHLQRMIDASKGHGRGKIPEMSDMLAELVKRLHVWDWITVLKTMITLHRLLQDGAAHLVELIIVKGRDVFNLRAQLKSLANSPEAHCEARFIRQYGRFLEERCVGAVSTRLRIEEDVFSIDQSFSDTGHEEALECLKCWDMILETVEEIEMDTKDLEANAINVEAIRLTIVDVKRFYAAVSIRLVWLLNNVHKVDKKALLSHYEKFTKHHEKLNKVFTAARAYGVSLEDHNGLGSLSPYTLDKVRAICTGAATTMDLNEDDVEVAPLSSVVGNTNLKGAAPTRSAPSAPISSAKTTSPGTAVAASVAQAKATATALAANITGKAPANRLLGESDGDPNSPTDLFGDFGDSTSPPSGAQQIDATNSNAHLGHGGGGASAGPTSGGAHHQKAPSDDDAFFNELVEKNPFRAAPPKPAAKADPFDELFN